MQEIALKNQRSLHLVEPPSAACSFIANVVRPLLRAVEGAVRPGPHYLPYSGGWLPAGASSSAAPAAPAEPREARVGKLAADAEQRILAVVNGESQLLN